MDPRGWGEILFTIGVTVALGSRGTLSVTYVPSVSGSYKTDALFDVTGYFTPDMDGNTFTPVTPARVLDSRHGTGISATLPARQAKEFPVAGSDGIPADAVAVTGTLTVTGQTGRGYVYLGPDNSGSPTTSTINFPTGDNRANGVTVPLSSKGSLFVTYIPSSAGNYKTDVIFDVTGYFSKSPTGATYSPLNPSRLLDTRRGTGLKGTFTARSSRTFQVAGHGGVPVAAIAVTGNLTVTNQGSRGYLYIGPTAMNTPKTSNLNFPVGDNRASGAVVPLSGTGTLSVTYVASSSGSYRTDVIFDVTGYFQLIPASGS